MGGRGPIARHFRFLVCAVDERHPAYANLTIQNRWVLEKPTAIVPRRQQAESRQLTCVDMVSCWNKRNDVASRVGAAEKS